MTGHDWTGQDLYDVPAHDRPGRLHGKFSAPIPEDPLDDLDERLIELLRGDGRLSQMDLARRLGVSRTTVAAHLEAVVDSGLVEIRGVVHPSILDRGSLAYVSVLVSGPASAVAERLAARRDAPFVTLTTGRHAIAVELRAASAAAVDRAVTEIRGTDGVLGVDTLSYVELVRDVIGPVEAVSVQVDDTDTALLRMLQEDGRASFVALAERVELSTAAVRRRVLRLLDAGAVRVGAVVRPSGVDGLAAMGIGVRLAGEPGAVVAAVSALPAVSFLARTLGRFDLLLTLRTATVRQLTDALDAVRAVPGVREVESWTHLRVVKESYAAIDL